MTNFGSQPPNVTIIEEPDRVVDGFYEIEGGQIQIHVFEILAGGQIRIPISQTQFRQSLALRVWVSEKPHGQEIFFRFHPGTGGASHLFYDKDLDPIPTLVESSIQRSNFAGQLFRFADVPVQLIPDTYFYNIQNMENITAGYKIAFIGPGLEC